jgi:hypothetical protein
MTPEITTPDCDARIGHRVILFVLNVIIFVLENTKRAFLVYVSRTYAAFAATDESRVNSSDRKFPGLFEAHAPHGDWIGRHVHHHEVECSGWPIKSERELSDMRRERALL